MELRGWQADVEVGAQRPRNLRSKVLAQALAGDAPDLFADQMKPTLRLLGEPTAVNAEQARYHQALRERAGR
jgi:hypothetical protein